jgi:GH15 family glucan-1,4-alpha-glucosidase
MRYIPIEEHGFIGDMHTAALVGVNGTIDWLCFPHFDSPSVFGAILDADKGGHFSIAPVDPIVKTRQLYHPDTNVLITRFLSPAGVAEVVDFMPVDEAVDEKSWRHRLIRKVSVVRGSMRLRVECMPAFNYARTEHKTHLHRRGGASFETADLTLGLATAVPLQRHGSGVAAEFTLEPGRGASFALQAVKQNENSGPLLSDAEYDELYRQTVQYWRDWLSTCSYHGRWQEMVRRSALALKLMTYAPTGAIVAAPTTSLPEAIGHGRNWDYRYTWVRDASFTLFALQRIGFTREAAAFMSFIEARCGELGKDGSLQIMYGLDGAHRLTEETLDHLEGYRGSRPVRVGNDAHAQKQLDIYGELLDSVFLYNRDTTPITYDFWTNIRTLLKWLCAHWDEPDDGLWEVRGGAHHFTYSKVMCWVAFERAMRIAEMRSLPSELDHWRSVRDEIFEQVMTRGWDAKQNTFTQFYGSSAVDASTLLMPVVKFLGPTDPRVLGTLDAIMKELVSDSLVYRYNPDKSAPDGLEGREGTFSLCTFWLVECLTRAGRLDEARLVFEKMFTYANHLGLYAEQIGPSGEALGNFPQAFTHLSLITAAFNLNAALDRAREGHIATSPPNSET